MLWFGLLIWWLDKISFIIYHNKMFKRIIKTFLATTILSISIMWISLGNYQTYKWDSELPFGNNWENPNSQWPIDNPWDLVDRWENSIIIRLLEVFWLDSSTDNDLKFIDYAKSIVNMALGLVSFIALIMSIYTFYMMFFTENEAWAKKAKWNLIGIFIALAIIWLAWIIVSFIFWRYQNNRTPSVVWG